MASPKKAIRIKENGNPLLSSLNMPLRKVIQAKQKENTGMIQAAFKSELLNPNSSRDGLAKAIEFDPNSIYFSARKATIQYTDDGSINEKTLTNYLKKPFQEAEQIKRLELVKRIDEKLNSGVALTPADWERANELGIRSRKPFNGRYKTGDAA
jgi:hypothetical protein